MMAPPGFFAPVISPNSRAGGFTLHSSIRPPPLRSSPPSQSFTQAHPEHHPGCPLAGHPAVPTGGRTHSAQSVPRAIPAVTLTYPTPISSPSSLSASSASLISAPPSYTCSSPPKYTVIPHSHETALLLAPPPTFHESIQCGRCLESGNQCHRCGRGPPKPGADGIVRVLIVLNLVVWAVVIWQFLFFSNLHAGNWDRNCGEMDRGYGAMGLGCLWASAGDVAVVPDATDMCWWALEDC